MTDRFARKDPYSSSGIVYRPLKLHLNCNFNLQPFGVHWTELYEEDSWNVFIKNLNFFSTEERNT